MTMPTFVLTDAKAPGTVPTAALRGVVRHQGVVGICVAQMWDSLDTDPEFATMQAVLDVCRSEGKLFAGRFRAGRHTPPEYRGRDWVPERGHAKGMTLPCPFDTDGTVNMTFINAYRRFVWAWRRWAEARLRSGDILHYSQFGGASAEFYCPRRGA